MTPYVLEIAGTCPICGSAGGFRAEAEQEIPRQYEAAWFRGSLRCVACKSPPRERAIARVLEAIRPNWRELSIHECSPGGWAFSQKLRRLCRGYVPTQFDPSLPFGVLDPTGRWRNENLEAQTFPDASFDIVIAQDVFEHLFHPGRAAKEIARTLKPDGVALLTVPVVRHFGRTQRRARLTPCGIQHILPEQYHGNPVGDGRSLVTIDWSYDIGAYLTAHSGIPWVVMVIDDMSMGIRDPYNTILIGWKAQIPDLEE